MQVYQIFDRLSNRHNWQCLSQGIGSEWFDWIITNQVNTNLHWTKTDSYPEYQIGYQVVDSDTLFDNLPASIKLPCVLYPHKDNYQNFLITPKILKGL